MRQLIFCALFLGLAACGTKGSLVLPPGPPPPPLFGYPTPPKPVAKPVKPETKAEDANTQKDKPQ